MTDEAFRRMLRDLIDKAIDDEDNETVNHFLEYMVRHNKLTDEEKYMIKRHYERLYNDN
jgi:hypothetical protein